MASEIYAHAASRIRQLRRSQGLPLEELAGRAEITPSYLGQIERLERKPSLFTIARIAAGLSVAPAAILDGRPLRMSKEDEGARRLLSALAGMSAAERTLALETMRFFFRRLRDLKKRRKV